MDHLPLEISISLKHKYNELISHNARGKDKLSCYFENEKKYLYKISDTRSAKRSFKTRYNTVYQRS
jgi:hypothetical protein